MNPSSVSIDLISNILSRLPAKSVARFRCVSKLWASILGSPYFTKSFLTMSSAKPRLLFAIAEDGLWSFFSVPQLQIPYEKSSSTLVVAAEFHVKFSPGNMRIYPYTDIRYFSCGYASGLFYLYGDRWEGRPLVCNPITGRYVTFPYLDSYRKSYSFFAFEPIDKQHKILFMEYPSGGSGNKILTLGTGDMSWRKLKCSLRHEIKSLGVCINGVLYYLGHTSGYSHDGTHDGYVIFCFDVRSETFTFIDVERSCRLINYKGKLAMIYWEDDVEIYRQVEYREGDLEKYLKGDLDLEDDVDNYREDDVDYDAITELRVWVLEDVETQEWSKYAYTWSDDDFFCRRHVSIAGVTAWGEIVFSMLAYTSEQPFYVFYFNPERNTLRRVEIQGFGETFKKCCIVWSFANHVEDLNVNDLKLLKSDHAPFDDSELESD